jgi:hypothetical protein
MTDELDAIFEESFDSFLAQESANIVNGVSERNLCGRLALCLEVFKSKYGLKNYYADTEYNRKQNGKVKTVLDDDLQVIVINCDLIFHSRGEIVERDNLIAIEMKKADRPEAEKFKDRARLRAMTKASYDGVWSYDGKTHPEHVCGYELGIYVELDSNRRTFRIEEFRGGNGIAVRRGKF